jgi:hypothetical protein
MQIMLEIAENDLTRFRVFPNPTNGSISLNKAIGNARLYHVNGTFLGSYNTDYSLVLDLTPFSSRKLLLAIRGWNSNRENKLGQMRSLLTILVCLFSVGVHAQFWIQKSSFGGVGRHRAVGCATENKGYLGLGHVNGSGVDISYKDWWEYDPSADTWSQKANYPVNNHGATSFVVNDQPCVGGGSALNGEFFKFDPIQNTWNPIASCPFFNPGDTQGFSVNNKGYVYVGTNMAEYDPSSNSWDLKATPPIAFGSWTCSFTIEGSGYVKAGNKLYEYKTRTRYLDTTRKFSWGQFRRELWILDSTTRICDLWFM